MEARAPEPRGAPKVRRFAASYFFVDLEAVDDVVFFEAEDVDFFLLDDLAFDLVSDWDFDWDFDGAFVVVDFAVFLLSVVDFFVLELALLEAPDVLVDLDLDVVPVDGEAERDVDFADDAFLSAAAASLVDLAVDLVGDFELLVDLALALSFAFVLALAVVLVVLPEPFVTPRLVEALDLRFA